MPEKAQNKAKTDGNSRIHKQAERQLFITFLSLPYELRKKQFGFSQKQQFAERYNLDKTTLSKWQRSEDFWKAVRKNWRHWGREKTPNIINALYQSAITDKKAAEIRLWLEAVEEDLETRVLALERLIKNKAYEH